MSQRGGFLPSPLRGIDGGFFSHATHHPDTRADGRKDGDERLNHQFPNFTFFHKSILVLVDPPPLPLFPSIVVPASTKCGSGVSSSAALSTPLPCGGAGGGSVTAKIQHPKGGLQLSVPLNLKLTFRERQSVEREWIAKKQLAEFLSFTLPITVITDYR